MLDLDKPIAFSEEKIIPFSEAVSTLRKKYSAVIVKRVVDCVKKHNQCTCFFVQVTSKHGLFTVARVLDVLAQCKFLDKEKDGIIEYYSFSALANKMILSYIESAHEEEDMRYFLTAFNARSVKHAHDAFIDYGNMMHLYVTHFAGHKLDKRGKMPTFNRSYLCKVLKLFKADTNVISRNELHKIYGYPKGLLGLLRKHDVVEYTDLSHLRLGQVGKRMHQVFIKKIKLLK